MRKTAIVLFMALGLLTGIFAQHDELMDELGLSDSKKEQMKIFLLELASKKEKLTVGLNIKKLELKQSLLEEDIPDLEKVEKRLEEIASIEVKLRLLKYEFDAKILSLLEPDQRKRYKMFRVRRERMKEKNNKNEF